MQARRGRPFVTCRLGLSHGAALLDATPPVLTQRLWSLCRASQDTTIHRMIDAADGILSLPGCFDGLSARCLHAAGFQGAFVSGYAVSAAMLGEPDLGLLYPPEASVRAWGCCITCPMTRDPWLPAGQWRA